MKTLLTSALLAGTVAIGSLSYMDPAAALSFNGGSVSINTSADAGKSFTVLFDGSVAETNVSGLSSQALVTYVGNAGTNQAIFDVVLANTSSGGIGSRTSSFGFDIDPNVVSGSVGAVPNNGPALFNNFVQNGSLPNGFGSIELCATGGPNCSGGGSGGVTNGQSGSFRFTLNLASNTSPLTLTNFGVRYQSITGTTLGSSGTGSGTPVPTPALIPAALGAGVALLRKKKQEQKEEKELQAV